MIQLNEYYEGLVKSLAVDNEEGHSTVGAMAPGEYEFGTSASEYMTVISGEMTVMLPGEEKWKTFRPYQTFMVPKDSRFRVIIRETAAYKCLYK